jgi:hypothetical protein
MTRLKTFCNKEKLVQHYKLMDSKQYLLHKLINRLNKVRQ